MTRWTKSLIPAALLAVSFAVAVSQPAWAERQDVTGMPPSVPAGVPPAVAPAVPATPALLPLADLDSAITELAKDPLFDGLAVDWTGLLSFYAENGGVPLFTTPTGLSEFGLKFRDRLPLAVAAGLKVPAPVQAAVASVPVPTSTGNQSFAEAILAAAFVGTAVDATTYLGHADDRGAKVLGKVSDAQSDSLDGTPAEVIAGVTKVLDEELPTYYRFWAMANYLPTQVALFERGGWSQVPAVKKIEPGKSDSAIQAIRVRLTITGELAAADVAASVASGDLYDPKLLAAVELFQRNHGLNDDGVIGGRTIEEMNVSAEDRVRQILLNLERMREEGAKFEPRHLIANIPSQEVKVIEDGKVTFYTKAIFGKLQRKSPTLSSVIHTVKLNPDWTAPAKIAAIDEVKRERATPGFLEAKGFTIYDRSGNVVSPNAIDWHSVGPGNFPYTLRQAPGPENALGPVKFDFVNDYAVFLHGTPTVKLFEKQDRFFSSGCVRTQYPIDLAKFVLQDDPEWPAERIDAVLKSAKTTLVKLKNPLPVHITYMTAWVDEDGVMQFRKDAYGYDDLPSLPDGVTQQLLAAGDVAKMTAPNAGPVLNEERGK